VLSLALNSSGYRLCAGTTPCSAPRQVRAQESQQAPYVVPRRLLLAEHNPLRCVRCCTPHWQVSGAGVASASGWVAAAVGSLCSITLGSDAGDTAAGTLRGVWVLPAAVAWDTLAPLGTPAADVLAAITANPTAPAALSLAGMTQAAIVGAATSASMTATLAPGAGPVHLRLTLFGATPQGCSSHSCHDVNQTFTGTSGSVTGTARVVYPRAGRWVSVVRQSCGKRMLRARIVPPHLQGQACPCTAAKLANRYVVRAQASDGAGGSWASSDFSVLVRKEGDAAARAAPCCRSTAHIIAQSLGRPVDPVTFRASWIGSMAAGVGWEGGYAAGPEELEAERLFDYGLLAPVATGERWWLRDGDCCEVR
jgi:hypothetical protein